MKESESWVLNWWSFSFCKATLYRAAVFWIVTPSVKSGHLFFSPIDENGTYSIQNYWQNFDESSLNLTADQAEEYPFSFDSF